MISDHDLEEHVIGPKSQRKYLKALDHQLNLLDALTDESPSGEMNRRWTVNFFDSMVRDARKNQTSYMLGAASGPEDHDSNGLGYLRAMVDILDVARTYYIDANMIGFIADVADSMPDDVAPHIDDVPSDQGFMYLETPIRTVDRWGKEFFVSGIVWSCGEKGFGISEFILLDTDEDMLREVAYANDNDIPWYPPDMSLYHVDSVVWGAGLVSPDTYRQQWDEVIAKQASKFEALGAKFDHEQVDEFESLLSVLWIRRFVVASWAVMHGKIARPKAARKSKVQARALKRRGLDWGDIRIVELRATISQGDDDRPHVGRRVNWSHRWMVRGFWRWQWYPSEPGPCGHCGKEGGVHRRKYIEPHIKGPEDLPYVAKDAIYVVDR